MAAAAVTFESLSRQIKKGDLAPVYVLHGKEGYFIDALVSEFERVIPDEDKEFNQYILYAPQVLPGQIMDICTRCPMMADRQIVIVKECQAARADQINRLHKYVSNPSPTTVLVLVFRGDAAKGKDLLAAARKKAVIFESKEVWDSQIPNYIATYVRAKGLNIDPKSQQMLHDHIGKDLSRLYNEIDKLAFILGPGATITPASIEQNIGISKEYNTFELIDALAHKNAKKAFMVADYFASNPKANPTIRSVRPIFDFYADMLTAYYTKDKSDDSLMRTLNYKNRMQLNRLRDGMRMYNAYQIIEAIWAIRQFDCQCKGKGSRQNEYQLFHDLIYHLVSAPGSLFKYQY